MLFRRIATILVSLLLLPACTKKVGTVGDYPDDIEKVMIGTCAIQGCHDAVSGDASGGLNLSTWSDLFKGSTNGSPVIPYNSKYSSLCYFINVYPELGPINEPTMPYNKNPLSEDNVKRIKDWIDAGAPSKTGAVFGAGDIKKLYAVNQGCDVVTVFDAQSQLPMRFISVGPGSTSPHQVRVSPDGKFWYVIFVNNNVMKKFRCTDDAFVADVPLTPLAAGTGTGNVIQWNNFQFTSDSRYAYVVSWQDNGWISKVDLAEQKLVWLRPAGYQPHGMAIGPHGDELYVASQTSNYLTVFDTAFSNPVEYSLNNNPPLPGTALDPHDVILSPDKSLLLISCQTSNEVRVFDLATKKTIKVIPTPVLPQEIIYSPAFNTYYVTCSGDNTVRNPGALVAIDGSSFQAKTLITGAQPHGVAVDENRGLLYLLSRNISTTGPLPHHSSQCVGRNGFVSFIDCRTFTVTACRYELSVDPYFISIRP